MIRCGSVAAAKEKGLLRSEGKEYVVKDGDMTVGQYTAKAAKDLGGDIKVIKFTHFVKGEGLEKRSDDFAAEVASMVK